MAIAKICSAVLIFLGVLVTAGCVTVGPRPAPKPRIGPQPRNAEADVLLLNVGPPRDTDGDTFPDTFQASTHMFDERYQLPVRVDGTLIFKLLVDSEPEPIHTWRFSGAELRRHIKVAQVGPVYRFRLQMPIDAPPVRERFVSVQCLFEDTSGHVTQAWHRGMPWLSVGG